MRLGSGGSEGKGAWEAARLAGAAAPTAALHRSWPKLVLRGLIRPGPCAMVTYVARATLLGHYRGVAGRGGPCAAAEAALRRWRHVGVGVLATGASYRLRKTAKKEKGHGAKLTGVAVGRRCCAERLAVKSGRGAEVAIDRSSVTRSKPRSEWEAVGSGTSLVPRRRSCTAWPGLRRGGAAWPRRRSPLLCSTELRGEAARNWGGAAG